MLPNYFQFNVDPERLSRETLTQFVEQMADYDKTERTLLDASKIKRGDGSTKADDLLDHLLDFEKEIDQSRAVNLLKVIGKVGDKLIASREDARQFFSISGSLRLTWVMQHLLARIPVGQRDGLLIEVFKGGEAVGFLCEAVFSIEHSQEKQVAHGPAAALTTIKPETTAALKQMAIARIEKLAKTGSLLEEAELNALLIRWKDWGAAGPLQEWIAKIQSNPMDLLRLLSKFINITRSTVIGNAVGSIRYSYSFKNMSEFIDLDNANQLLAQIGANVQLGRESSRSP